MKFSQDDMVVILTLSIVGAVLIIAIFSRWMEKIEAVAKYKVIEKSIEKGVRIEEEDSK